MNIESTIIKYLLISNYYNKYYKYINLDFYKNNNKLIYKLLVVVSKLHEEFRKDSYSPVELQAAIHAAYPAMPLDEAEFFNIFLSKLDDIEVAPELAESLFTSLKQKAIAHSVAASAIDVVEGRLKFDDFGQFLEKELKEGQTSIEASEASIFLDIGLDTNLALSAASRGLKWRLKTLRKIFGDLQKGDFGFIFARPEVGKTTFLASEVAYFLEQLKDKKDATPVLWVNNEQRGSAVILRIYSAYFGVSEIEIRNEAEKYNKLFKDQVGYLLKFIDDPTITKAKLEIICEEIKPCVLIFDQLDKVNGFDGERNDLILKSKYQWARELAKKYGVGIGVCQAGGTAENKKYLDMNDVDSSHTAKQGEADWILGIGKVSDAGFEAMRYLSVCKNKLPQTPDTEPTMRHAKVDVFINEAIARYEDRHEW